MENEIKKGDIFWYRLPVTTNDVNPIAHPHVVISINREYNKETLKLCAITTNRKRASWPGNVILDAGEGGLSKVSIVDVSHRVVLSRSELGAYIGSISHERMKQIISGICVIQSLSK